MKMLTKSEETALKNAALILGVKRDHLFNLINFESRFNPMAMNPKSSAKGLIQFVDKSARKLGYTDSYDLILKNPTIETQLKNCVIPYLKQFMPFPTEQSLYMAVFYPVARNWPLTKQFPKNVTESNPTIETPYDYIRKVYLSASLIYTPTVIIFVIAGITAFLILSKKI